MRTNYPRLWVAGDTLLLEALASGHMVQTLPPALLDMLFQGGARLHMAEPEETDSGVVGADGNGKSSITLCQSVRLGGHLCMSRVCRIATSWGPCQWGLCMPLG